MTINTGGSAFPTQTVVYENGQVQYGDNGMTLRDYFAAKAMQGLFANSDTTMVPDDYSATERTVELCARVAYEIADAMLKERNNE